MGLLRAAIIFLCGNFTISLMKNHLDNIKTIPIIGNVFGESIIKFVKKNQLMFLLIVITLIEFIFECK